MSSILTRDTGETSLPTVVCLHSLFLNATFFDALVAAGRGRFRFLCPTFPGQDDRLQEVDREVTMDDCVADLERTLARAGVERFALVGQSMGGDVAVRVAARHPSRVSALVLAGSSARAEPPEQLAAFRAVCDRIAQVGFDAQLQQTVLEIMLGASTRADPTKREVVARFEAQIASLDARLSHAVRGVIERADATPLLAQIKAPTLIINGLEDMPRPPAWSAEMARHIPGAEHRPLNGIGHSPTQEAPELVLPLILGFLARHATT